MRILMVYRWSPYTTAAYLAKAFRELGHDVRSFGPVAHHTVPERQCYRLGPGHNTVWEDWAPDLLIWVEAGQGWCPNLNEMSCPKIGYFIDSHSWLPEHVKQSGQFDKVFCAQKQYAGYIPGAEWLPVACDPEVHTPTENGPPTYDIAFVGNTYDASPVYERRRNLLAMLKERYACNFVSNVYFEDMANVYASAKIAFNVSTNSDLNMRVFEAICAGTALLTDENRAIRDIQEWPPWEWATYRDDTDLCCMVDALLRDDTGRRKTAALGRAKVLAHHTYRHRAERMLA